MNCSTSVRSLFFQENILKRLRAPEIIHLIRTGMPAMKGCLKHKAPEISAIAILCLSAISTKGEQSYKPLPAYGPPVWDHVTVLRGASAALCPTSLLTPLVRLAVMVQDDKMGSESNIPFTDEFTPEMEGAIPIVLTMRDDNNDDVRQLVEQALEEIYKQRRWQTLSFQSSPGRYIYSETQPLYQRMGLSITQKREISSYSACWLVGVAVWVWTQMRWICNLQ
jgi:hypothetical protein